jgi:hypothetical protein
MTPAITSLAATPEFEFPVRSRVNQRLFPKKKRRSYIDQRGRPKKQEEAYDGNYSHCANAEVRKFCDSRTDTKYPAIFPITVQAT